MAAPVDLVARGAKVREVMSLGSAGRVVGPVVDPLTVWNHSSVTLTPVPHPGAVAVRVLPTAAVPAIVGVTGESEPGTTAVVGADDRLAVV